MHDTGVKIIEKFSVSNSFS